MKIGDYVRTKYGIILKIKDIGDIYTTDNIYIGMSIYDNEGHFVNDVEIIKSSPNIIDLIEVGDYVNGKKVEWIGYGMYQETKDGLIGIGDKFILFNEFTKDGAREKDIKSIVTKEQFKGCEYKL